MAPPKPPKPTPVSLQILRRRVLEEMRRPGNDGEPRFKTDAQLAHFLGVKGPHVSLFLRSGKRGISWALVDKLAQALEVEIWQLFYTNAPYKWRSR